MGVKLSKKIILGSAILLVTVIVVYFGFNVLQDTPVQKDIVQKDIENPTNIKLIKWGESNLFNIFVDPKNIVVIEGKQIPLVATFALKPDLVDTYSEIGVYDLKNKPLIIIPVFTASAYSKNGFYDFYDNMCDTCLTTKIVTANELGEQSSANAVKVLELLGYDSITDVELDKNPSILSKYDKIILLHNEYATQKMFDAIVHHPNVIYLYPNALYAEISVNYEDKTISLIRGHGYPDASIGNGFNLKLQHRTLYVYDEITHAYEYDKKCTNYKFIDTINGKMLNCYPEQIIWKNKEFLKALKES